MLKAIKYKNAKAKTIYISTQHEFCLFACAISLSATDSDSNPSSLTRQGRALTIKHLTLRTQAITLGDQIINLLTTLQHTLDGLMQHNLGLVELLLDLHDAVCLLRILVLDDILLELGKRQCGVGRRPRGARVLGQELVDDLREQLVRHQRRVVVVADYDAGDALHAAPVRVECVVCKSGARLELILHRKETRLSWMGVGACLVLPRLAVAAWPCALGHRFAEQRHEFAIARPHSQRYMCCFSPMGCRRTWCG